MLQLKAKDLMNAHVISVPAHWTIEELGQFLVEKAISGAPVVDEDGTFIGVVSLTDIVRQESYMELGMQADEPHDYYLHGWENRLTADDLSGFHIEERPQITVREIMTPMIFKVDENTPVQEIADTMVDGRVHRLLVTREGKIVGIITTMDILKVIRDM